MKSSNSAAKPAPLDACNPVCGIMPVWNSCGLCVGYVGALCGLAFGLGYEATFLFERNPFKGGTSLIGVRLHGGGINVPAGSLVGRGCSPSLPDSGEAPGETPVLAMPAGRAALAGDVPGKYDNGEE
jgi:hypothetical protein